MTPSPRPTNVAKPNVVFILADDLGYGDLSCNNFGTSTTPHIDTLMRESVSMSQHYSAAPLCAPARAALVTGRYPHRCGVIDTISAGEMNCLATRETTSAQLFNAAGYNTGLVGKWHLGHVAPQYHPSKRGFEHWACFDGGATSYWEYTLDINGTERKSDGSYLTDVFTDYAVDYIDEHKDEPFFLYLAYNAPHGPFEAPEQEIEPFRATGRHTEFLSRFYAMVKKLDDGVGRVLEQLDKLGLSDNTIVIFTSDNGPQFSGTGEKSIVRFNCGFRGSKGSVHEGGIRVPLAIRWPDGLDGQHDYHDVVHFADWLPTLADACGVDVPGDIALDGQSVLPALRGEGKTKLNPTRFWQFSRGVPAVGFNAAMRDGDWKLVRPGDDLVNRVEGWECDLQLGRELTHEPEKFAGDVPPATGRPVFVDEKPQPPMLFNLGADPLEHNDLAATHPDRVSRMMRELENWWESVERDRASIPGRQYRTYHSMQSTA